MRLLQTSAFIIASVIMISDLPANADTKVPDFSQGNNPLQYCKRIKLGTESTSTQIGSAETGNPLSVHTTSQDQIGYDCDQIADSLARVEINKANNETLYKIQNKKVQVQLMQMFFTWQLPVTHSN
jgi:hypothetical protein